MKSKRLMTIGIVLALLIAVVGVVLSVSLTACGKDVITVRSEKELLKAAGTSQEKTIVLMDDVVVNGDLKVAAPNKIDLNGFGLEVKGTLSADGSGTLVVGTTALILARRETVKAQKIDINMPQGHVEWNANIELPASAATSADAMTVVTSASSFVFKGVFKIGGAEADIMLTLKGGRFEISNMSESSAATVLVPEQAVGAAVENLSQGAMRVEAHSDVAVGGEVEISSKNSEVNVTALESQAETKITVTDGTVKKIDAAGAQVVVAESAQAGDVVAEKLENNGTVTGAVVADEIVNNGTLEEENVNAALKTAAKKALNDSFATYSQDDYTSDNWAKLTKAKDDGLAAIDSALTEAAIQSAKNAALDAMAAVETIAEATAEAKAAATAALKTAFEGYTETDYDAQTWATLKAAYDNGLAAIEAATDVSAVNTAKQTALDAMAACVPKDVEALTQAKAEAKAAIETAFKAYDEDDYASANWTELTIAYNKGLNEVDAATSVSAVNAAKQKALDAMAAVKNNATLLAEAKTAALAALDAAKAEYSQADYATNWSVLEKAYNDGKAEINAAAAIEAVNSALQKATDAMAAVKSDATLLKEEQAKAIDELNREFESYKVTDYNQNYKDIQNLYNQGMSAIEGAETVEDVQTALRTAVYGMKAVKSDAVLLAEAKAAATKAVQEAFDGYKAQDYNADNWESLENFKEDGIKAIANASRISDVEKFRDEAIANMAAIKTNAQILAEAKELAKTELKAAFDKYNQADYTQNWSALEKAYNDGVAAIDKAELPSQVTSAKEAAVNAMAAVQADATEVKNADSLKAAVEAKYIKIILAADIDNAYIEVNYDLTLDLNGHTLTLADRTYAVVKVNGGAHFTLCDGSAAKSGKIKSDYAGIIAIGSDADKAVVEINGGTIEVDNSAYWSNDAEDLGYAVYADNAEVEMSGGAIIAKGQYMTKDDSVFGINLRNGSSATVTGGSISSTTYGVVVYYNSAFTLDGGEITATWFAISGNNLAPAADITVKSGSATSTEDVAIYMPSQGSLTVSGGHIKGLAAIDARMGEIEISGGTLESTATEFKALTKKPGGVAVYDGSVVLFNVEMYVNDNTTSRPTGDGNNDFNAVVTGGTFVSAIENGGTDFSVYFWNSTTQKVTLDMDAQQYDIVWFDFVDDKAVKIIEDCLKGYVEGDYSAANWQAILDILAKLETELASAQNVAAIVETKVEAAKAAMAALQKAKTIATADEFSQAVAEQKDGDEWRIGASFEVAPFEITSSVSVVGTAADVTLTVNADAHFVTIKGANIEVSFKNIALKGKIDYNGIYFDSAAIGAKLTLDNTGISNVKRGVSIAADNASVVINSSEIVARYYGVTVGASGVELSVNGGTVQGWAAIMFTANDWTVDRIKSNKGAVVNAQGAELVGRSISDEGYGIVVVQQDYNGAELTFTDCTMLTTVEDGKTGAWQGGIVVRSYGNKISVSGGYIESSNMTERNLMGMALVSLYNTYFAQTEADPQDKANEFSISNWEIDESFETPFVLRDGIDTLTVDFGEPLEGTYAVQDERWYDINSTTENYSVESDLTAIVDQDFYVKNQGTLTIKAGATLTVESDVAFWLNDGNTLVIEAGATLVVKGAVVEGKIVNNGRVEVYGELAEQTSIEGNGEWVYGNVTEAEQLKALFANEALSNLTIVLGADFGTEEARSEMSLTLARDAVVTLDMNGHSIYSAAQKVFWLNEGSLTVDNGLIDVKGASGGSGFAFRIEPLSQDKVATLELGSGLAVISHTSVPVFLVPQNKTDDKVLNAFLVTEADITSKCNYAAIQGNGTKHGTSITINGGKISGELTAIYHPQYGEMTVNGGEIEGATAIEMRAGKLVVNSGTMIGNGNPFESDPNGNGATTLGAAVAAVQHTTKLDLSVEINGGTLQGARAFYQANLQNNGKEALEKISITLGKSAVYDGEIIVDSAEATIEDDQSTRYYMTLQQAVDAAEDDETVVVVKDLSASGAEYFIKLDDESKTVTVDLNGKTLLYTGSGTGSNPQNGEAISVSAGKLVLKNGTVNMVNDKAGGSVYWGIRVHGTGSLAMSKVTVKSEDSPLFMSAVSAGGKIYLTLDECHIEGDYSAVYMNGSTSPAEITINNSTIVSKDVGIYVSNSVATGNRQKLTITDSTVTGTTAIEVKHTDATITGCTLIGTAEQLSVKNGNGSCTEGFAFAVTGNGDTDKTTGTVVVSGCKFYNGKPSSTDAEENGFYFVFTTAEGASVTVDGAAADETAAYGAYEARVSNAWFDTFENAVKYAEANGKTVVLLKDVEVGEAGNAATGLVVSGTVTVDFNGFIVSNVGTGYAVVVSGSDAKVTLIDSSKEQTGGIYGGSGGDNQALRVESGATLDIYGGNYNVGGDAQGKGNSTVAIRTNSTVNIYGGRFASEKDYQGKYFVLNVQQTTGASGFIKVYGGTFVGQNPADGDDALGGSFVADGYEAFVSKAATDDSLAEYTVGKVYEAGSEEALRGAIEAAQGFSVVRLTADVELTKELKIENVKLMIDFNGHTVSNKGTGFAIFVKGSEAKVIFVDSSEKQTGGIHGGSGGNNQALRVQDGANVEIYGGNYNVGVDAEGFGNSTVAISTDSVVYIYGGRFASEGEYEGKYFVLNVQQTTGAKGEFKVFGGTFVGQNPADGDDALGGSFVAEGYEAFVSKEATDDSLAEYTVQKAQ